MQNCDRTEWTIKALRDGAECKARSYRTMAAIPAILAMVCLVIAALLTCLLKPADGSGVTWAIAQLSVPVIVAGFLLFVARSVWNYSNVWLGRAGTLEDLTLALSLSGADTNRPVLSDSETQRLLRIAESLERLRRTFEGDLLRGPAWEVPGIPK